MNEIADRLFNHIESLQKKADSEAGFTLYPKNADLIPNDAIYLLRARNLKEVCKIIGELVEGSGKSLGTVLKKSIQPELNNIVAAYPYTSSALEKIIADFS